jgi:hypothetical protein
MIHVHAGPIRRRHRLAVLLSLVSLTLGCSAESNVPRRVSLVDTMPPSYAASIGLPGIGTDAAELAIIDSLGTSPRLAYHYLDNGAVAAAATILVPNDASGDSLRLVGEPAWTLRDVDSVRVDVQDDTSALVVLLLRRTPTVNRYLAENARHPRVGAVVVNSHVLRTSGFGYLGDSDDKIPVPIADVAIGDAERFAERLRAAVARTRAVTPP